jgi:EAL domain-containing protein (putative c-di-GMP-specific phosphodiesterase class I)
MTLLFGHIHTPEELLKRADIAMYQAKLAGKNRQRNFDVDMQKQVEERLALEGDLRRAVQKSQFILHLQAQYNNERRIFGAEVLLRWLHPARGLILPGEFISVAEETGDIVEIGKWIIETACSQLKTWQGHERFRNLVLAINVSPKQFHDNSFVDFVSDAITRWQIDPTLLKLEITESLMLDNIEVALEKMAMLRESGVSFSLDDFGTGYSSLSYLKRLPLSQLKIDQSFVRDVTREKNDATLVRTIIGMAENLNLSVIAEGVEEEAQLHLLAKMGCHAYQGYFLSRPVALTDFERLIA